MIDINKIIGEKVPIREVAHSSVYAQSASGDHVGSGYKGLSIEKRKELRYERRHVKDFTESELGRRRGVTQPRSLDRDRTGLYFDASTGEYTDKAGYSAGRHRHHGSKDNQRAFDSQSIERRKHFNEPRPRNYDPYGK